MARDRKIDPVTKDYVDDGAGGRETTLTAQTSLHHQIHIERGTWPGDSDAGSQIPALGRLKNSERTTILIADAFVEAALPMVEAGRLTEPVSTLNRRADRLEGDVETRDIPTEEQITLSDLLPLNP